MKILLSIFRASFLFIALCGSVSQAAILNVIEEDGFVRLLGASNVSVQGVSYDVEFQGGTCADVFSGCDSISDFVFQSEGQALAASQALLDQVLIDTSLVGLGIEVYFDTQINSIAGCETAPIGSVCEIFSPFALGTNGPIIAGALNFGPQGGSQDLVGVGEGYFTDTSGVPATYAVWTLTAVPIPGTVLLFTSSLGMLILSKRHLQ